MVVFLSVALAPGRGLCQGQAGAGGGGCELDALAGHSQAAALSTPCLRPADVISPPLWSEFQTKIVHISRAACASTMENAASLLPLFQLSYHPDICNVNMT